MMDTGTVRNMQFYSKNKFEKLEHIVGFIIRIYHNAGSTERQKPDHLSINMSLLIDKINEL